jgi:hypothetical protein
MPNVRRPRLSHEQPDSADLHVIVLDQDLEARSDATVRVRLRGSRRATTLRYDEYLRRHTASLKPGVYELRVGLDPSMEVDRREIAVQAGANTIYSSVAPLGTPYYVGADGEKIYFRPEEGRLLLYASGVDVAERLPAILRDRGIAVEPAPEPPPSPGGAAGSPERARSSKSTESARFMIPNPPITADPPAEAWQELARELEELGFVCRVAALLLRGKGIIEGLTTEFVVSFTPEITPDQAESLAKELGCEIDHRIAWMPNGYLMRVRGLPRYDVLAVIETFRRMPAVVYAEPNVVVHIEQDVAPNDYLLAEQTYGPVIHAQQAWNRMEGYLGAALSAGSPGITVAVFDGAGVSPNHPDLTGNLSDGTAKMVANFNFRNMANQTVATLGGDHGTACASVAAGRFNNGLGFPGIAGNCHLIGARLPFDWTGLDIADAWMWAASLPTGRPAPFPAAPSPAADVISNSWGVLNAWNNTIRDALDYLTVYGRGGKGCVVCFSVGNFDTYVQFSAIRRYAAYSRTIAVGASINANPTNPTSSGAPDPAGQTLNLPAFVDTRAYYSPFGPELDLVAPSHTAYPATGQAGTADPVDLGKVDPIAAATLVGQGHWIGQATTATALAAASAAGAASISVASTAGFAVGATILIGAPGVAGREFRQVQAVGAGSITVNTALTNAHAVATQVATGPRDYDRSEFGGTSHSCPSVAGAVALILSVRPELTWTQVRRILRESADPIDVNLANADGRWRDAVGRLNTDPAYAGPVFSQWYGFGRLNLDAAVQAAHDFDRRADIVVRDNLNDSGAVPSPDWWAASPDIWVSAADVPVPVIAYTTDPTVADPTLTNAERGHDNYVFVRVKNVGPIASDAFWVRALVTHFPGFEFRYPQEWMPSNAPGATPPSPLTPGSYLIGEQTVNSLGAGAESIRKFTWPAALVPPDSVTIAGVIAHWHPCLLAEVSPHDGPTPAATGIPVQRDNNLAQRNITVSDSGTDDACAVVAGTSGSEGVDALLLDCKELEPEAAVFVRIDDDRIMDRWFGLGRIGSFQQVEGLLLDRGDFELPLGLPPGRYVAVVIGLIGGARGSGVVRVSQRLKGGEISAGYEIRRW